MRVISEQGYRVLIDLSTQVLRLAVAEETGLGSGMSTAQEEAPVAPTLAGIADEQFISASVLAQKAKQFDDGLYAAGTWKKKLAGDPDVGQDARMMVPLFYGVNRKRTKVWVFMGWANRAVEVSFATRPTTTVFDPKGKQVADSSPLLRFENIRLNLAYPVSAEVYVTKIFNRDEFREHCDRYKTRSAILDYLN